MVSASGDQLLAVYLTEGILYVNNILLIDIVNSLLFYRYNSFLFSEGGVQ